MNALRKIHRPSPYATIRLLSYEGAAPAPRVVVVQFESLDTLQALYNSAAYKDAIAIGDKYATQRIFGVEGVSP
jgi:uncharacterized protein (DUF1330 family)